MWRQFPSLHVVGAATSPRVGAVRAASKAAQLSDPARYSPNIASATSALTEGIEVLVLLDAGPEDFKTALAACDERGLPRWAVVPASPDDAQQLEAVSAEWEERMLTRAIWFALRLLELRRENARLRGDLCTVGRRLTHDLRTPLNSISTANEALAEVAIANESAAKLHRSISTAVEDSGSLLERIGTVLLASARPLDNQQVEMEEIVWNARQRLDTRLRAVGANIVAPSYWPVVNGAPALLELVWVNLLANSEQHGGPAPLIELGWNRSAAGTCFWIRDSGPGVPVAKRQFLFHPVDRLNELNAPRGYGLSLVQRLVELHGGSVGYESDPEPGGTFSFTLS